MKIKKELRRWAMLALVLVLLFSNTVGASANAGAPSITVNNYEELCSAIQGASNLDTILIRGVIEIPEGALLGSTTKTVTLKSSGGFLNIISDAGATEPTRIINIIFDGGGLELLASYLTVTGDINVTGCTFKNCGMFGAVKTSYSEGYFTDCTFKDNKASYGAHIGVGYQGTARFTKCAFTGGVSTNRGGGIYLDNSTSTATITDCIITENTGVYGGGIASWGTLTVSNTLLYGNTASVGGTDLFSAGSYTLESVEDMAELFHNEGLEPLSWDSDYTDIDYGATALKLNYTTYEAPVEPEPTDPPVDPTDPTEPEDPDKGDGTDGEDPTTPPEEPTTPDEGDKPTDPPTTPPDKDPVYPDPKPSTPSDAEQGGNIDNSTTDNSDHSTTDNSQHSSNVSNVDNSSQVGSTDNSRSESSKTKNSNNTTTYNYYQTEQDKGSTGASQPIIVNVTVPQDKEAGKGSQEPTEAKQNIYIDAEGVNVRYEYTADGVSISISPYKATESPKEVNVVPTALSTAITQQEPEKSSNSWVDYVCMSLLAVLVLGDLRDRFRLKKGA